MPANRGKEKKSLRASTRSLKTAASASGDGASSESASEGGKSALELAKDEELRRAPLKADGPRRVRGRCIASAAGHAGDGGG